METSASFEARSAPSSYPTIHELRLSEDAAYKRIQAARAARQFPALFTALAEGRLHLAGICLLAPHLTPENAEELIAAATHKTKCEVEQLLAQRFPRAELLPLAQAFPAPRPVRGEQLAPGQVEPEADERGESVTDQLAPGQVEARVPRAKVAPVAFERFALQVTIEQDTHDKLRYAQALLSHQLPSGDIAQVVDRALDALIAELEKQKFAATARPRRHSCRSGLNPRYIPAHVKRAVWERDQGQCTFVSDTGRRCESRKFLEFDHVDPVALGGQATVEGLRLLCRGHNEYEAERM